MNTDFPRILSLLRKERRLSQKQAAADLGVAQALLSHYEKGKRECGLEFLVKAADYYNVSTDYLLGRSPVGSGAVSVPEAPGEDGKARNLSADELSASFAKKLVLNSVDLIYSLLGKAGSIGLTEHISELFNLTIYKAFRLTYRANSANDKNLFRIPEETAYCIISAGESAATACAVKASKEAENAPEISRTSLEQEYKKQTSALLGTVMNCEKQLEKFEKE